MGNAIMWNWFKTLITGKPHFIIDRSDGPYLHRRYIIPRNRFFNIYLHHFLASDEDAALHCHPWWSFGVLLKGQYLEYTQTGNKVFSAGTCKLRGPDYFHRVELIDGPVWTLFITGPKMQEWGFLCPKGFVKHENVIEIIKDD